MNLTIIVIIAFIVIILLYVLNKSMVDKHRNIRSGIAVIKPEINNNISGVIRFEDVEYEDLNLTLCKITVDLSGVPDGDHGFHIHEKGDATDGCKSAGPHYNPMNVTHGDIGTGHAGDLGNLTSINSRINKTLYASGLCTDEIIGRTIVLHAGTDDLGKGGNDESLKTGNAGSRIACGIIGIA